MSPQDFLRKAQRAASFIGHTAPHRVGQLAVNHFKASFDNEGFTDRSLEKWKPLKPKTIKQKTKKDGNAAGILIGEGTLKKSIDYDADYNEVTIHLNKQTTDYGEVHNEGLRAGRGKGFLMPKRQFMGESEVLNQHIIHELEKELTSLFS